MVNEVIPRNLNQPDTLNLGMGLKIRFLDLPFFLSGGFVGYCLSNKIINIYEKGLTICCELCDYRLKEKVICYVITGTFVIIAFVVTKIKIENQSLAELASNFVIYSARKSINKGKDKDGK